MVETFCFILFTGRTSCIINDIYTENKAGGSFDVTFFNMPFLRYYKFRSQILLTAHKILYN